jgi:hypothetical protein
MTEPIRIRVRTNFAVNSKSISHEQTVEIDAPVVPGDGPGGPALLVDMGDGLFEIWSGVYTDLLREAREVAAQELERRKAQFLAPVVA